MSLVDLEQARRGAVRARERFERTLAQVQHRLSPANLAGEAWEGVKDRGADVADGALQAVKKRPAVVSLALGAFALFLARAPLKRAVRRMMSDDEDGIEAADAELIEAADEGVS